MTSGHETWKSIPGYESLYQVSTTGMIRTLNYKHTGRVETMIRSLHRTGYYQVSLHRNPDKQRVVTVHRLMAITFFSIPSEKFRVYHINGIKTDNRVENLLVKCL